MDKNSVFNDVVAEVRKELGDSQDGVRVVVRAPGKGKPLVQSPKAQYLVPETGLDPLPAYENVKSLLQSFPDFRLDTVNTKGTGSRRVVRQKIGAEGATGEWETFEQASRASARWVFHREVVRQFKAALGVVNLADPKLDAIVGIGSAAHSQVSKLASEVVDAYVNGVRLVQRSANPYVVGSVSISHDVVIEYDNAVHAGYSGLNPLEITFAAALDAHGTTWARNPARSGYGIPLISPGPTDYFFPDFLAWTNNRIVCIETKGEHLVRDTAARKLLSIKHKPGEPRLDVQFISAGKFDSELQRADSEGFTAWSLKSDGKLSTSHFADADGVAAFVLDDDLHDD